MEDDEEEKQARREFYGAFERKIVIDKYGESLDSLDIFDSGNNDSMHVSSNTRSSNVVRSGELRLSGVAKALPVRKRLSFQPKPSKDELVLENEKARQARYRRLIRCIEPKPKATHRLFCLHYAGGTASVFRDWHTLLDDTEVVTITLPGRDHRIPESMPADIDKVADRVVKDLWGLGLITRGHPDYKPYSLFGVELGALVAFLMCRILRTQRPTALFVCGLPAPNTSHDWVKPSTMCQTRMRTVLIEEEYLSNDANDTINTMSLSDRINNSTAMKGGGHTFAMSMARTAGSTMMNSGTGVRNSMMDTNVRDSVVGLDRIVSQEEEILHSLNGEFEQFLVTRGGLSQEMVENKEILRLYVPLFLRDFRVLDSFSYQSSTRLDLPIFPLSFSIDADAQNSWQLSSMGAWGVESRHKASTETFFGDPKKDTRHRSSRNRSKTISPLWGWMYDEDIRTQVLQFVQSSIAQLRSDREAQDDE